MKCFKHAKTEAIGACVSCGSGLCKECRISVKGITYCKPCLEGGKMDTSPTPSRAVPSPTRTPRRVAPTRIIRVPQSTRRPIRPLFFLGAIGMIILMVAMSLYTFYQFFELSVGGFQGFLIISSTLVFISSIITGIGFFGYWWNYALRKSLVAFIITLVFSGWIMLGELQLGVEVALVNLLIRDIGIAFFGVVLDLWGSAIGDVSLYDVNEWLTRIAKIFLSIATLMLCFSSVTGLGSDFLLLPGPIEFVYLFRGYMVLLLGIGTLFLILGGILTVIIFVTTKFGLARAHQDASTLTTS